jgi:hypothetical protein
MEAAVVSVIIDYRDIANHPHSRYLLSLAFSALVKHLNTDGTSFPRNSQYLSAVRAPRATTNPSIDGEIALALQPSAGRNIVLTRGGHRSLAYLQTGSLGASPSQLRRHQISPSNTVQ